MDKKRTKIVATISSKNCSSEFIKSLYDEGMNVVRINSAHLSLEEARMIIRNARAVSDRIAIMIDTKGPEIRTTICDGNIKLLKGKTILIKGEPEKKTTEECIYVTYTDFVKEVGEGTDILIDDGEIELRVIKRNSDSLVCSIENDASLGARKSVNIPGSKISLPSINEKDRTFIKMAIEEDIDFIAHSFVRNRHDAEDVQKLLDKEGSQIKIIAKIENQEGVDNIDEILDVVYGVMVARGDLGIEIPFEKIPGVQRMIIGKCIEKRRPVIVATQMLQSMITSPRPTRAEVSDIANAIYSQTDAIMLSGETANGKYPVESVMTMNRIALETELNKVKYLEMPSGNFSGEISSYLAKAAVKTSVRLGARGIVADTTGGRSIRDMAAYRGINLILAQCYDKRIMRELSLSYGVYADCQEKKKTMDEFIHIALKKRIRMHNLRGEDIIVVIAGNFSGDPGFSFIEVGSVSYLKDRVSLSE